MEPIWVLGLMSGTSLDGVDAACLQTDGRAIFAKGKGVTVPYPSELRDRLYSVLGQEDLTLEIAKIERDLTLFHADVVKQMRRSQPFSLIGFHGHTIFHAPPQTWQIGDGELLATETGVEVVYDFRSADVANGGQGAPLVPIFHQAITQGRKETPIVVVNIGGVANMTWIHQDYPLIACDTGPGGALLDDWVSEMTGAPFDENGTLAAQGHVHESLIQQWLAHPYFAKAAPKSLDRNDFYEVLEDMRGLSPADGAATLLELTALTIVQTISQMPEKAQHIYSAGGGGETHA